MRRSSLLAAVALLCVACGGDDDPGAAPTSSSSSGDPPVPCPDIGVPGASAGTCVPRTPAAACATGTMPVAGEADCAPVGWTQCAEGFEIGESGWSCRAVLPAAPCDGATRPELGAGACVPIGDCGAAFPPQDATLFVDPAFSDAELDATHVRTIAEATSVATAGDVIAVESGAYPESIALVDDLVIVGRCAAEVRLTEPGGSAPAVLLQQPGVEATVRGLAIEGHRGGIVVTTGRLTVEDVLVDGAREIGVAVLGAAEVALRRSVVRGTTPADNGALGRGLDVEAGGRVTLAQVSVEDSSEVGVYAEGATTRVEATRTAVLRTQPAPSAGGGRGVYIKEGASFVGTALAVAGNHEVGLYAIDAGTTVMLADAVVEDTRSVAGVLGEGLTVDEAASLHAERVTLFGNREGGLTSNAGVVELVDCTIEGTLPSGRGSYGGGLQADPGASVTLTRTAIVDNADIGVAALGATITATDVLVTRQDETPLTGYGIGMAVFDGQLTAERLTILRAETAGLMLAGSAASTTRLWLSQSRAAVADGTMGYGLAVLDGAHIDVASSIVDGSASVGMIFSAGSATVRRSFIQQNPVGVHAQDGSRLLEGETPDPDDPLAVLVGSDCFFIDNQTRVGSGSLPLPNPTLGP